MSDQPKERKRVSLDNLSPGKVKTDPPIVTKKPEPRKPLALPPIKKQTGERKATEVADHYQ